jgi:hypothetical protein
MCNLCWFTLLWLCIQYGVDVWKVKVSYIPHWITYFILWSTLSFPSWTWGKCYGLHYSVCWFKSFYDILMTILEFTHWRRLKQVIWFQLGWGCRCNRLGLLGRELHKQARQVSASQQEVVPLTIGEGNESLENLARESQSADFSPALGSENFQGGPGEQFLEHLCTVCLDAPKHSFFDTCGHRCTCYSCGMRYLPIIQWQQMIPFADVLVVCWWGFKQLGHGSLSSCNCPSLSSACCVLSSETIWTTAVAQGQFCFSISFLFGACGLIMKP